MMAHAVPDSRPVPPLKDQKRVKVYELREADWFDRGTGFCTASFTFNAELHQEEPRVVVVSEAQPEKIILETKITREDGFQKQQDTLIVWTEPSTAMDMALSFQEAEGCSNIWRFVSTVQSQMNNSNLDDALSDDMPIEAFPHSVSLDAPTLGNIHEIEAQIRSLINTQNDRDALGKFVMSEDYIRRLIPLVEMAEDMEDLGSLHRLCHIMKTLILLNDTSIIEYAVTDDVVLGVVGALEYDPDFPSHKANHRQWLGREGRYKEVVRIGDDKIRRKIHQTYRLQYLKDVVLARILDDPTFSVLNSLIFFNQVDIVSHLQTNAAFLKELFSIFGPQEESQERKKEAVLFIQQCCAIAKNLQTTARLQLYNNFLGHGLLSVINFGLRHTDVAVRVGATDVLVSMIDHDPHMVRQTIFRQISEKQTPLTDSLIDLLLVEADFGVKAQIADAIKILLDPGTSNVPGGLDRQLGADIAVRGRPPPDPQQEEFVKSFYEDSAKKLFKPLVDLKDRDTMEFTTHQVSLFIYLIEILCFFVRQHTHRSKYFVLSEKLGERIAQLLSSPEKYLRLTALKFFRSLIALQDEFYNQQMMHDHLFEPILNIVLETMPRDNLLNSACLELFEFIRLQSFNTLTDHLVENYRDKIKDIKYVDTFQNLIRKFEQSKFAPRPENPYGDENTPKRPPRTSWRENGIKDMDAAEEEYFNTSDDEEETGPRNSSQSSVNGASPLSKPLVDYPSDEENSNENDAEMDAGILPTEESGPDASPSKENEMSSRSRASSTSSTASGPPERLSEKRRREEDEEDELGKLAHPKRRNSSSSQSNSSTVLRRKKSFTSVGVTSGNNKPNKIAISLSTPIKSGVEGTGEDGS